MQRSPHPVYRQASNTTGSQHEHYQAERGLGLGSFAGATAWDRNLLLRIFCFKPFRGVCTPQRARVFTPTLQPALLLRDAAAFRVGNEI